MEATKSHCTLEKYFKDLISFFVQHFVKTELAYLTQKVSHQYDSKFESCYQQKNELKLEVPRQNASAAAIRNTNCNYIEYQNDVQCNLVLVRPKQP